MKDFVSMGQYVFASVGVFFGWFVGGFDGFVYTLVVFVVIDYLTGVMASILKKELSSGVGFRGIFKKVVIFCLVAVGHIIDTYIIKNGSMLRDAVIFFYLSNEGISILENAGRIGLPIPEKLRSVLEQLREEKSDDGK
ncbi:phage holin family protein [Robinsoniella peoriensis]|uniref:phage holin family protein n=1 Tax=Robinsoniella peoriensis TaxID=180332 RepID=UPI0005C7E3C6|nr:phage holin family protein [Robinsoniella peoriensis]